MQEVSPLTFMNGVFAYQTTAALKAAVGLDLFTAVAEGQDSAEKLARRIGTEERGARILADFLTVRGYLEKEKGRYRLTADSAAFLDRRSPAYMGSMVEFLASPEMIELVLSDPAAAVREGGASGLANLAPDNPVWVKFARAMGPGAMQNAQTIAEMVTAWPVPPRKVLDIAAGHGMYGIMLLKAIPQAQVTAVDWSNVLTVAKENAERLGVADRLQLKPGSAFEVDWSEGYDLTLVTGFLHHFDTEGCVKLLKRVHGSLAPGGRALVTEFVPNPDRVSPPLPAAFALTMLLTTPRGDAYTAEEIESMARAAGFQSVTATPLSPSPQTLLELLC
jgi:2-polyprenyl-3-methyl-5-hydroxy-6-metoxy-1,4-benzoquinol methylase